MNEQTPSATKPKKRWYLSGWALVLYFIIFIFIVGSSGSNNSNPSPTQTSPSGSSISESGFLRLPNNNDPEQVICLGPTKESYNQIGKALLANDMIGLLEIPGAFCVSNGSRVKLIESSFALRRVRIETGVRPVDSDKVGMSGWVAKEFVVKQ